MLQIFLLRIKATNQACTFRLILNSGSLHQLSLLSCVTFCPMDQPNLTKKWHKWVYETFGSNGLRLVEIQTRFPFLSKNSVNFSQTLQKENYWGPLTKNNDTAHCFNPLTPKIWLLILLSSYYTFPCKLVMGTWWEIKIAASTYTW